MVKISEVSLLEKKGNLKRKITVETINPEALGRASEIVTQFYYEKYLERSISRELISK